MSDSPCVGASAPKKLRSAASRSTTFNNFCKEYGSSFAQFKKHLDKLKQKQTALGVFEIGSCNAADFDCGQYGYCFTKASCSIRPTNITVAFASLFCEPFKALTDLFCKSTLPEDGPLRLGVEKLMDFMMNKEIHEPLEDIVECTDETEVTVLLANHLFSQLSLSPAFTVDKRKLQIKRCPCSRKHGNINYGDTSIGNPEVWHGCLDLIMEGAEVIIDTCDGNAGSDQDVDSVFEDKQLDFEMTDVSAGSRIAQIAAETIVYSFYYRYLHPEHSHALIPCIGISYTSVVFYFYDSVHDIMLGSTRFPLLNLKAENSLKINITTLFALWMVLNHKHLCNGLALVGTDEMPKSNFMEVARSKLDVYKEGLKRGDVWMKHQNLQSVDPVSLIDSKFILPPELDFAS